MTANELARQLRTTPARIKEVLRDGSLRSLERADIDAFLERRINELHNHHQLVLAAVKAVEQELDFRECGLIEARECAIEAAMGAVRQCFRTWERHPPLKPTAYIVKSAVNAVGRALDRFNKRQKRREERWQKYLIDAPPRASRDQRMEMDDPRIFCPTPDHWYVLDGLMHNASVRRLARDLDVDRSVIERMRWEIGERYIALTGEKHLRQRRLAAVFRQLRRTQQSGDSDAQSLRLVDGLEVQRSVGADYNTL